MRDILEHRQPINNPRHIALVFGAEKNNVANECSV
jgi:hypothetical protein